MDLKKIFSVFLIIVSVSFSISGETGKTKKIYKIEENIFYRNDQPGEITEYMKERCRLDIYYPQDLPGFASVVWFHGGGLSGGEKYIPQLLREKEIAVIAVNYRLHPNVKCPIYIDDAAAAVAWVFRHIAEYGGDSEKIFIAGHSAGGYLTSMLGMNKSWLKKYAVDADNIAGLIPFSGHTITHFTIRKERGIPGTTPVIDEYAPLFHVRKNAPPILLITGDREMELLGRYEENVYFWKMMKEAGHSHTFIYELEGFDHGGVVDPGCLLMLQFIQNITEDGN